MAAIGKPRTDVCCLGNNININYNWNFYNFQFTDICANWNDPKSSFITSGSGFTNICKHWKFSKLVTKMDSKAFTVCKDIHEFWIRGSNTHLLVQHYFAGADEFLYKSGKFKNQNTSKMQSYKKISSQEKLIYGAVHYFNVNQTVNLFV